MKILIANAGSSPLPRQASPLTSPGALLNEYRKMKEEVYLVMPLYGRVGRISSSSDTGLKITVPLGNRNVLGRIFSYENSAFLLSVR